MLFKNRLGKAPEVGGAPDIVSSAFPIFPIK
jgi:hypothetical protein